MRKLTFKKSICVISGSRAEYGLLKSLIKIISKSDYFSLKFVVTGSHLSKSFGKTEKEINEDKIKVNHKIKILTADNTPEGISNSVGQGIKNFGKLFGRIKPNLIIVLGDRFEIMSAAIAAMFNNIPIAHIHGGERTQGMIDDQIRNAITKISHIHFVAAKEYAKRVNQMGEPKKNIFMVGGLGVDVIKNTKLLSKKEFENLFKYKFSSKNLLVTFHPVTLEHGQAKYQTQQLLNALDKFRNFNFLITAPNSDAEGVIILKLLKKYSKNRTNVKLLYSLGSVGYLSALKYFDVIVGNSSSGLLEVPTFKKPTVNIGSRQEGRLLARSVINCEPKTNAIVSAINKSLSKNFKKRLRNLKNPYGNGGASKKIFKVLINLDFEKLKTKKFYDI
jgi:GDP/UDP-N,N'-diacetylbacillosamine 2-epimerase (hydrolysing)